MFILTFTWSSFRSSCSQSVEKYVFETSSLENRPTLRSCEAFHIFLFWRSDVRNSLKVTFLLWKCKIYSNWQRKSTYTLALIENIWSVNNVTEYFRHNNTERISLYSSNNVFICALSRIWFQLPVSFLIQFPDGKIPGFGESTNLLLNLLFLF